MRQINSNLQSDFTSLFLPIETQNNKVSCSDKQSDGSMMVAYVKQL